MVSTTNKAATRGGRRLRELLAGGGPVLAPGAADGLSVRTIADAGFPAIYLGGGAMTRTSGYPDVGVLQLNAEPVGETPEEFARKVRTDFASWEKISKEAGLKFE